MAKATIRNKKTADRRKKPTTADPLIKGGKKDKPELTEDELKDVTGGSWSFGLKID